MKRRPTAPPAIDPAELAAGYLFPELFEPPPFSLISEEAEDSPFNPQPIPIQATIPDLPAIDWESIRRRDEEKRRQRRRNRRST